MIGFFQNSMAKHHRLIFGVLLVFIVVSFVFYTGSGSAADLLGLRRSAVVLGVNVNNPDEVAPYRLGAALGNARSSRGLSTQDVVQRIFLVKVAESFQMPEPTQAQFSEFLSEQGLSAEAVAAIQKNYGASEDDLRTALVQSWKISRFLQTFGNVPAVFEADVELAWKELFTRWTVELAEISPAALAYEDRLSAGTPEADEKLRAYYDANKEDFRVAELVGLSFAKIVPAPDAAAKIPEPTDFELTGFIAERVGNVPEKVATEMKDRRAEYVAAWKKSQALDAAAAELSNTLYEKLPTDVLGPRRPEFAAALENSGLDFAEIPMFPRDEVPADTGVPAEILAGVLGSLNDTLWRTDAIPAGDAVYVVVFRGTEPSRVPAFEEVRAEVEAAWRAQDKEAQFLSAAQAKGEALAASVASGEKFSAAAAKAGFSVSAPPAFTVRTMPAELAAAAIVDILKSVEVGEITPMFRVGDAAAFARLVEKDVPAPDKAGEDFALLRRMFENQISWETLQAQLMLEFSALCAETGIFAEEAAQ